LEGNIPQEINQLQQLIDINLSNNRLSGIIAEGFFQIKTLEWIQLQSNLLTGTFQILERFFHQIDCGLRKVL